MKKVLKVAVMLALTNVAMAVQLVSDEEIEKSKKNTKIFKLSNGIPVIYRSEKSSDIINVNVSFDWGLKDQKSGTKTLPDVVTSLLVRGSKTYPQKKLFEIMGQYSLNMSCSSGIDTSHCSFQTINDYFDKNIDVFSSAIKEPIFLENDLENTLERLTSSKKSELEDPNTAVNQVVNEIYYNPNHPYLLPTSLALKELSSYKIADVVRGHKQLLNARRMTITVVTSLAEANIKKILDSTFGSIQGSDYTPNITNYPKKSPKKLKISEMDIPTSYIIAKFPAPNSTSPDATTAKLLFSILSEEMNLEIRTKRSLSYAAYAYTGQGQIGLGVFAISTPKPKEALKVLTKIIKKYRNEQIDPTIFEEHKRVFSTGYFLSQETHGSLSSLLQNSYYYNKDTAAAYDLPKRLSEVTAKDVLNLSKRIFKDFRVGVVGRSDQIKGLEGILN